MVSSRFYYFNDFRLLWLCDTQHFLLKFISYVFWKQEFGVLTAIARAIHYFGKSVEKWVSSILCSQYCRQSFTLPKFWIPNYSSQKKLGCQKRWRLIEVPLCASKLEDLSAKEKREISRTGSALMCAPAMNVCVYRTLPLCFFTLEDLLRSFSLIDKNNYI